tara:strand:+ start:1868 stop:2065 length:198 start_codon:yes stop_codon:yes gene_type:complete
MNEKDKVVSLSGRALDNAEPEYVITVLKHGSARRFSYHPQDYDKKQMVSDLRALANNLESRTVKT